MLGQSVPLGRGVLVLLSVLSLGLDLSVGLTGFSSEMSSDLPNCKFKKRHLQYDPNKNITLTMSKTLIPDRPNRLQVRSVYPITSLSILPTTSWYSGGTRLSYQVNSKRSADGLYQAEVDFRMPFVTDNGDKIRLNVTYEYCLPDQRSPQRACKHTQKISEDIDVHFVRRFVVILGESDKPIYKPGENIHFRFIALNSRQLYPTNKKLEWPKFHPEIRNSLYSPRMVEVSENERRRREAFVGFDMIYIEDANGRRVKEWVNVSQEQAFNLSFPLPTNAYEGVWRLFAKAFFNIQTLHVEVKNYVPPQFLANIQVPNEVDMFADTINFNVCAKYPGLASFRGHYDARVCLGYENQLREQQNLRTQFENMVRLSGTISGPPELQCLPLSGSFLTTPENGGCVIFNTPLDLIKESVEWLQAGELKFGFYVKIREADTDSFATLYDQTTIRAPNATVEMDTTYRPGLPIYGKLRLSEMNTVANRGSMTANLTVFDLTRTSIYSTQIQLNSHGVASFILPPVKSENDLHVQVNEYESISMQPGKDSVIRWRSRSGLALKVRSINSNLDVHCRGTLKLTIMANSPLAGKTLFMNYASRFVQAQRSTVLQPATSGYACSDEDSDLGHYTCNTRFQPGELGEINCRTGWTGENCLRPHKSNGMKENVSRTIFMHEAIFNMDSSFGPTLNAVVYVINNDSSMAGGYELISDHIRFENLQLCLTPAITASRSKSPTRSHFNKHLLMPGDRVVLQLNLPTVQTSDADVVKSSCILRLVDRSMKNFVNFKDTMLDLNKYISELRNNDRSYYVFNDKIVIRSTKTAFEAAGLNFIKSQQLLLNNENAMCPTHSGMQKDSQECFLPPRSHEFDADSWANSLEPHDPNSYLNTADSNSDRKNLTNAVVRPRVRDFFPEVWLFEHVKLDQAGQFKTLLTAPDSVTSWEFTAMCFTPNLGIWMPPRLEPETVTVSLPFYVEFTPPVKATRHEVLHVPVTIFILPETSASGAADEKTCYEVAMSVTVDRRDWQFVSSSNVSKCVCQGDINATFTASLKPLRLGRLNVTVEARTVPGSTACTTVHAAETYNVPLADAVRHSILVVPEGVELKSHVTQELCIPDGSASFEKVMHLDLPNHIVEGSLRSYVSVSGFLLGQPVKNLSSLIHPPRDLSGEYTMMDISSSVYLLKYLVAAADLREPETKTLAETANEYISRGYITQLMFRKSNGSFSAYQSEKAGSTWITANAFGVFSEAERLQQEKALAQLRTLNVTFNHTLSTAFEFLKAIQRRDGCFVEYGRVHELDLQALGSSPKAKELNDLLLTSYVLSALAEAPLALREGKSQAYSKTVELAGRCILHIIDSFNISEIPTRTLAKVAYALRQPPDQSEYLEKRELVYRELLNRVSETDSPNGALRWWTDNKIVNQLSKVGMTAYAYLALAEYQSVSELRPIIRWLLTQQNERYGFFYFRDCILVLQVLAHAAGQPQLSIGREAYAEVTASLLPGGLNSKAIVVNWTNANISQQVELGYHSPEASAKVQWEVSGPGKAICVVVQLSALYNVLDTVPFSISVHTIQAQDDSAECTQPMTTICVRLSEHAVNSGDSLSEDMILLTFESPTGWKLNCADLPHMPYPGLIRAECDAEEQKLFAYFDPFTDIEAENFDGRDKLVRCITPALNQTTFFQPPRPSLIRVQYNDAPLQKTEISLQLNTCKRYWQTKG